MYLGWFVKPVKWRLRAEVLLINTSRAGAWNKRLCVTTTRLLSGITGPHHLTWIHIQLTAGSHALFCPNSHKDSEWPHSANPKLLITTTMVAFYRGLVSWWIYPPMPLKYMALFGSALQQKVCIFFLFTVYHIHITVFTTKLDNTGKKEWTWVWLGKDLLNSVCDSLIGFKGR